jgi:hypothetical protein
MQQYKIRIHNTEYKVPTSDFRRQKTEDRRQKTEFRVPSSDFRHQGIRLCGHKLRLKKQTQFAPAHTGANSFVERDYGNIPSRGLRKNKANLFRIARCVMRIARRNLKKQSQFSNIQMSVTSVMTKDYVKRAAFGGRKNKANLV